MIRRSAFTLVELIAVMAILSVLAAVTAPLIASAGQAYTDASNQRSAIASLAHALDRASRVLAESTGPVALAARQRIVMTDGAELRLIGTTLWLTTPGQSASPLCQDVTAFNIQFRADDGATNTASNPANTQRINLVVTAEGVDLAASIYLRHWEGAP
jgi:prepilin-type N-terminal cleavage/methylation domain-containing protein